MKRLLLFTPAPPGGTPTQGELLGRLLSNKYLTVQIISRAGSPLVRFLDVVLRGWFGVVRSDVVLVNVYGGRAFAHESIAVLYASLFRKRCVVFLRGGWLVDFIRAHRKWGRFVLSLPDRNIAPHNFLVAGLREFGIRVDETIPNFIELDKYTFRLRSQVAPAFLYTRGMHEIYNPEMTIRAFADVVAKIPEAQLTLAGSGERQEMEKLVDSLGLADNTRFVGLVTKVELRDLISQHDIYLQSNRVENMPVSILEMWASGIPVIATNVGGTPALVENESDGLLVRGDNPGELANACLRLLKDRKLVENLSRNGRERVKEFTAEQVYKKWINTLFPSAVNEN